MRSTQSLSRSLARSTDRPSLPLLFKGFDRAIQVFLKPLASAVPEELAEGKGGENKRQKKKKEREGADERREDEAEEEEKTGTKRKKRRKKMDDETT